MPLSLSTSLKVLAAAGLASVLAIPIITPPTAANAVTNPRYQRSFSKTATIWLADIKTCVVVKSTGVSEFTIAPSGNNSKYIDRVVRVPKLDIRSYNKCGSGRKAKKLKKISVKQAIYSSTCSVGVGIGVGLPWSISVSGSIQCGQVMSAKHTSSYGSGSHFTQSNSSTSISIGNEGLYNYGNPYRLLRSRTSGTHYYSLPVPIEVNIVAYTSKTKSDSAGVVIKHSVAP
jgi:hypothetical protein